MYSWALYSAQEVSSNHNIDSMNWIWPCLEQLGIYIQLTVLVYCVVVLQIISQKIPNSKIKKAECRKLYHCGSHHYM